MATKPKARKPRRRASVTFAAYGLRTKTGLDTGHWNSRIEAAETAKWYGGKVVPVIVSIRERGRGK